MIRAAILYHVYSGQLFFTALALFAIGITVRRLRVLALLAIPLAFFSGTPMPLVAAIPLTLAAIVVLFRQFRGRMAVGILAVVVAAGIEVPWHVGNAGGIARAPLFVLGDSLASGGFGEQRPWPGRLGARNLSSPSETVASALGRDLPAFHANDVVIVELGGNDMLEGTPLDEFERSLDALLGRMRGARVVMLELPILPGRWGYGSVQRRLARKHGVVLIPKRILARVLTVPENTTDGLHLTDRGHEQLARGLAVTLGRNQ